MRYLAYDESGNITGAYLQDLRPDHATRHIEATENQARNWVNLRVVNGRLESRPPPAPTPPPVPSEVTMRQARLALLGAGLLDAVEGALNAMPEKTPEQVAQKKAARIEWEYAQTVQRDKGLTVTLAASLGMKDDQVDALFIAAEGIK